MHNDHHTSHNAQGFGKNTNGLGIFILALIFTAIGLFVWWLWNNNHKEFDFYRIEGVSESHQANHGTYSNALGALDTLTGNYIYEVGEEIEIVLPDSAHTKLMVGKNSTEAKLFAFLSNDEMQVDTVDKTKGWITCDRIFFETGKFSLTENSVHQVERLTAIINAFPNAAVKVGGYTDTTGSADINTKLSAERAAAVASVIGEKLGRSLESEGYGPLHPIADNDTPEGMARNRRVDLRVTKK